MLDLSDSYYCRRRAYERLASASSPCPLRGWAPDLAAGLMAEVLEASSNIYTAQFLHDLVQVWDAARHFTRYIIELKFSTWQQLPWLFCGLGHIDEEVARRVAQRVRAVWAETQQNVDAHEKLTLGLMLTEEFIAELDAFIDDGRPRIDCQSILLVGRRLRLARCNEMSLERLHRIASLALSHSPSGGGQYQHVFGVVAVRETLAEQKPSTQHATRRGFASP